MSKKKKKSGSKALRYFKDALKLKILIIMMIFSIIYCLCLFLLKLPPPEIKEFNESRFVLIPREGSLGGVLSGIAYYFEFPLWIIRVIFALSFMFFFYSRNNIVRYLVLFLLIAYILLWMCVPSIDFIPADFIRVTGG